VIHFVKSKTEVLEHFGPFRYCTKVDANWPNWCHECTSSLKQGRIRIFASNAADPLHWTQNSCFGTFRTISILQKVDDKQAELVPLSHKFAKKSRVGIFRNKRTQSTPFDLKLMFWGVSDRFVTARNSIQNWPNWCHYRTSLLSKVASEFFGTNAPEPLHWTKDSSFGAFWTVSLLHENRCKTGRTGAMNVQVR
jgi:hypothetical protein